MKALFYGGAISALAGLALGVGMAVPADAPAVAPDDQPVAQQASAAAAETYASAPDAYPPSYLVNAAYDGEAAVDPAQQTLVASAEPPADAVIRAAWQAPDETAAATPQDVAAAGDTTSAPEPAEAAPEPRPYASIDDLLNQQQAAQEQPHRPSI